MIDGKAITLGESMTDHWTDSERSAAAFSVIKYSDMLGPSAKMILLVSSLLCLASVSRGEHEEDIVFAGCWRMAQCDVTMTKMFSITKAIFATHAKTVTIPKGIAPMRVFRNAHALSYAAAAHDPEDIWGPTFFYANGQYYGQTLCSDGQGSATTGRDCEVPHGNGTYVSGGREIYSGEWWQGHMDGRGEKKFDDGREYTGHFKLNNLDGVGEMKWPDGRSFRGTFKNNREGDTILKML